MLFGGLLFFVFLIILRPQDFVPGLVGMPIVFVVMGALLALWVASPVNKQLLRTPQDRYMLLFFFMIVISSISTRWITYVKEIAIETSKTTMIYFFVATIVDSEEKFRTVTWVIVLLMTIVGFMGVMQYYGYDLIGTSMVYADDKGVWQIRGVGNFDNPNDLAYSVAFAVPFALGGLLCPPRLLGRIGSLLVLAVSCYCIYLTHSRGGLLALITGILVWFILFFGLVKRAKFGILLVAVVVAVLIGAFYTTTSGYREDKSSMGRVEAWATGMAMLKEHPLIGVGKGQFIEHHERDSHNTYVRAGAELGVIGLYAFIGILFFTARTIVRMTNGTNPGQWRTYYAGYGGYLGAYMVGSLFSTRTYDIVFLVVVALIAFFKRSSLEPIDTIEGNDGAARCAIIDVKVIILTIAALLLWKLFLVQAW